MQALSKLFLAHDCSMLEINPLVLTADNRLLALDAKMSFDDNALFRHPDLTALRDLAEEEPSEIRAGEAGLSFVQLDGNIGCLVNGAGLAMSTMDLIKLHGGQPANFLDVGGGANVQQVTEAFRILVADPKVKAVLVNIFGGIMRCTTIARAPSGGPSLGQFQDPPGRAAGRHRGRGGPPHPGPEQARYYFCARSDRGCQDGRRRRFCVERISIRFQQNKPCRYKSNGINSVLLKGTTMSILVNKSTRVICQGITGKAGQFHTTHCKAYGTQMVGGVTPGRGGQDFEGIPIFDTVAEAVEKTGADATMIFVPPPFAADAIMEAADAGIRTIVAITEGIPVRDMVRAAEVVRRTGIRLIGPNCPGVITPEECKIGIMPGYIHKKARSA